MKNGLVIVVLIGWILFPINTPAGDQAPSPSRWGITTKKNLENSRPREIEKTESALPSAANPEHQAVEPEDKAGRTASNTAGKDVTPPKRLPADIGQTPQSESAGPPAAGKKGSAKQEPAGAAAKQDSTAQPMRWTNEKQKERCDGYLTDLRAQFLNTRNYSIQGASCDTATSAGAFLDVAATCEQNCPPGLLEHSGYTERIIRNIRYLEKLGNDRCSGSLTPSPPKNPAPMK